MTTTNRAIRGPSVWTVLGHEQPVRSEECSHPGCLSAQPWDIFCPDHEHLLALTSRPRERWKLRWSLGYLARLSAIAAFPVSARWNNPALLFILALCVIGLILTLLSRNYRVTRNLVRDGFMVVSATWILLRFVLPLRSRYPSVELIANWAPLALTAGAGIFLVYPARVYLRTHITITRATRIIASGLISGIMLVLIAYAASTKGTGEWGLPPHLSRWLLTLAALTVLVALLSALLHAWWRTRATVVVPNIVQNASASSSGKNLIAKRLMSTAANRPWPQVAREIIRREMAAMSATLRRSGSIVRDAFRKVATTVRSQLVAASRYMRAVRHYYGEALLVGIAAAARCLRWIVYRICVPMLCVFVSTAAAWSFAVATNDYMQGKPLLVGWLTALKAGAFGALAIASAVIGWTPVSGCHRVNVLHSTAIATRTVAPRLLLIFAVGAVTVEAMNLVDHLWPIRPGPLTAIALLAVAWSLWGSRQDQPVAPQPPSDPLAPPMSFRQIDRVK